MIKEINPKIYTSDQEKVCIVRKKQKLENGREISKGVMISLLVGLLEPTVKLALSNHHVVF